MVVRLFTQGLLNRQRLSPPILVAYLQIRGKVAEFHTDMAPEK